MRIEAENPLSFDFDAALLLNGERLESSGSSGSGWISLDGAKHRPDSFLARYGLDPSRCCELSHNTLYRARPRARGRPQPLAFPQAQPRRPARRAFYRARGRGNRAHPPGDGRKIRAQRRRNPLRAPRFARTTTYIYPKCCRVPALHAYAGPRTRCSCATSRRATRPAAHDGKEGFAGTVGVFGLSGGGAGHTAHSALRFEMPLEVEWLPVWRVEGGDPAEISLF